MSSSCLNKIYIKEQGIRVDCGKCINCIKREKKQKAYRTMVELKKYKYKYFITLTYDNENLIIKDKKMVLNKNDLQKYIRAVRDKARKITNKKAEIKYIACGEYGKLKGRPHYHIVLGSNKSLYNILNEKWKKGKIDIQTNITNASVFYVAGYTSKKKIIIE